MWWGKDSDNSKKEPAQPAAPTTSASQPVDPRKEPTATTTSFDPDRLPARKKLPASLQAISDKADKDENFYDELVDG